KRSKGFAVRKPTSISSKKSVNSEARFVSNVVFLNPRTCGIYKDGGKRYKTDPTTGQRTADVDNDLIVQVTEYLQGNLPEGAASTKLETVFSQQVLVPTYYDERYNFGIEYLLRAEGLKGITLGELIDTGRIKVRGGHGSPGNDQR